MGGAYEVTDGAVKRYYSFAGMTVAMNDGAGLQYLLTDHLGSVVAITDASGTLTSQQRYLPFGQLRTDLSGPRITQTDFGYTGQRDLGNEIGLYDYRARFYDSLLMRFISPDSIVPGAGSLAFNRYTYVNNDPVNATDPTGHYGGRINEQRRWFQQAYGSHWRDYFRAWRNHGVIPPTCKELHCGGKTSTGNATVSPRACNDVDPACGPNYYYGPVDPPTMGSFGSSSGGMGAAIGGDGSLDDVVTIVPAIPQEFHVPLWIYDIYAESSYGTSVGNGSTTIYPDAIRFEHSTFTTDGYITADSKPLEFSFRGIHGESVFSFGITPVSWDTLGLELGSSSFARTRAGSSTLGIYEEKVLRVEYHPRNEIRLALFVAPIAVTAGILAVTYNPQPLEQVIAEMVGE